MRRALALSVGSACWAARRRVRPAVRLAEEQMLLRFFEARACARQHGARQGTPPSDFNPRTEGIVQTFSVMDVGSTERDGIARTSRSTPSVREPDGVTVAANRWS